VYIVFRWCAIEFVTELIVYGETWYKRCTTENHSEVKLYNFPQSEIITLQIQVVPNINFKISMQMRFIWEIFIWTDHVRNEEVLLRVKEHRNILHEIRKRNTNWTGHILRRNCLLQRVTEGKIKVKEKQSHYRPGQALSLQEVEAPRFRDNRHMKVIRLSVLRTGRLYPQEIFLVLISVRGWVKKERC